MPIRNQGKMKPEQIPLQIAEPSSSLAGRQHHAELDPWLGTEHGPDGASWAGLLAPFAVGAAQGWLVCPPGSAHRPTVRQGSALLLHLLPQGGIEFTAAPA